MSWWESLFRRRRGAHGAATHPAAEADDPGVPIEIEIRDILDLHAFSPADAGRVVEAYLEEAVTHGFRTVRIIHGKGIGVQRERVRAILARTPVVAHFEDAPLEAGSWGATVVWFHTAGGSGGATNHSGD